MQYVCQYLDKEYSFAVDIANCIHAIEGMATKEGEGNIVVLNERMLLACDVEKVVKNWTQERVESLQEYCRKRWKETNNSHLKVRYGWALWSLTGHHDHRLLNGTITDTLGILESFLVDDDFEHASVFCHYLKKIFPYQKQMGQKSKNCLWDLIEKALLSDNENLRFLLISMMFHQVKEDESNWDLVKKAGVDLLTETSIRLAETETKEARKECLLEMAVFFADRMNDVGLRKRANVLLGDYKMSQLRPDDDCNMFVAHHNDKLLNDAMGCYQRAGHEEKLKEATLAYEANQPKLRYFNIPVRIPVENLNQQIDMMNNYIESVVKGGTTSIIEILMGEKLDVFLSSEVLSDMTKVDQGNWFFQEHMGSNRRDSFQNSKNTTHEKSELHWLAEYTYKNFTFPILSSIICNGLKDGTLTYEILREELLRRGFGAELNKVFNGKTIGTTYFDRVDIGINSFLDLLPKYINEEDVDWRFCICFLTTQFEGLFRDIMKSLGELTVKRKKDGDTELILLEGLLFSDTAKRVFSENDLMLFRQSFTRDGYNIRNEVAHGMLLPQEFTAAKSLLVFLCVLRLTKAAEQKLNQL